MEKERNNPILRQDYPDVDVIRVEDTYYMISTTMHFMPGGVILRSYDLVHWEFASYVYDVLEDTKAHRLEDGENIYGKGMWAASLRYHKGIFYVCFVANEMGKTYLYQAEKITGPWRKQTIEGFYHDCSLLFEEDGRTFIVYGNRQIHLTELNETLTAPKIGGLNRIIVEDKNHVCLGYEGSHFYKINGRYYVFFIHWPLDGNARRTEACFSSDSLEGTFIGGDILDDDMGYCNQGVAQGGIVDTPEGDWYAMLFQDSGAVGRIPVLVPMNWENERPILGIAGKVPSYINVPSTRQGYEYEPMYGSDDFSSKEIKPMWQWNHNPDDLNWSLVTSKGGSALRLTNGKVSRHVLEARNTLTQRLIYPSCEVSVSLDASGMNVGDYAGLCAFQGCYGYIGVTREEDGYYLVVKERNSKDAGPMPKEMEALEGTESERLRIDNSNVSLKMNVDFTKMKDEVCFYYRQADTDQWNKLGTSHKLYFKLDHFTGCRAALFSYATKAMGGFAEFSNFIYEI